ncbi:MAG: hypothetical protein ACD_79C00504G0006 [uncultured bacterium]|nr:MAG: hypothetical protein ACD_79C00504G0006 [uncultured bacterium]
MKTNSRYIAYLIPALLVFLLYGYSLKYDFIYDDFETIVNNVSVHSLKNAGKFFYDRETTATDSHLIYEIYRPVKNLSCAMDYYLYKRNASGYHFTNLIFHLIVTLLLLRLFRQIGFKIFTNIFCVSLFAVHPVLSHNVSYISARADIICAMFLILTLLFYLREEKKISDLIISYISFVFACFSKETAIIFPLFIVFVNIFKKQKYYHSIPFFLIAGIYFITRQNIVLDLAQQEGFRGGSFFAAQAAMVKAWVLYITGFLLPVRMDIIPAIAIERTFLNIRSISSLAFLLAVIFMCFRFRNKISFSFAGLLWFVLFLLPVSNLIPIKAIMSWRFIYIPFIGLIYAFAAFIDKYNLRTGFKTILFIWLGLLSVYSFHISSKFYNDYTLWMPLIEKYPHLSKPYRVVSFYYLKNGSVVKAREYLEKGLKIIPNDEYLKWDLAKLELQENNIQKAYDILSGLSELFRKEAGYKFTYDFVYACYQLEKYDEIFKTIKVTNIEETPPEVLFIQAHACVLTDKNKLAVELYKEILNKDNSIPQRNEILGIIKELSSTGF